MWERRDSHEEVGWITVKLRLLGLERRCSQGFDNQSEEDCDDFKARAPFDDWRGFGPKGAGNGGASRRTANARRNRAPGRQARRGGNVGQNCAALYERLRSGQLTRAALDALGSHTGCETMK